MAKKNISEWIPGFPKDTSGFLFYTPDKQTIFLVRVTHEYDERAVPCPKVFFYYPNGEPVHPNDGSVSADLFKETGWWRPCELPKIP